MDFRSIFYWDYDDDEAESADKVPGGGGEVEEVKGGGAEIKIGGVSQERRSKVLDAYEEVGKKNSLNNFRREMNAIDLREKTRKANIEKKLQKELEKVEEEAADQRTRAKEEHDAYCSRIEKVVAIQKKVKKQSGCSGVCL